MKAYHIFYLLTAFDLGISFTYMTLDGYKPQAVVTLCIAVLTISCGLFFKKKG